MSITQTKKVGLALGGGGSRALTHLGVLEELEKSGVRIDAISGNSMGAILGAMYAANPDAQKVHEDALAYFKGSSLFGMTRSPRKNDGLQPRVGVWGWLVKYIQTAFICNMVALRKSLLRKNPAQAAVRELLAEGNIEDLKIPYSCVALNLTDGAPEIFTEGSLKDAVNAGTAVGMVFPPYKYNDKLYIDAAPVASVPVSAARKIGAEVVLAVDIRSDIQSPFPVQHGLDVVRRIEMIESKIINDQEAADADVLMKPQTGEVFWGDFTNLEPIIEAGRQAVRNNLERILEVVK